MLFSLFAILVLLSLAVWGYLQLPVFGANPTGERLARIQQSPNYRDGKFQNLIDTPILTGNTSALRSTYNLLFHADPNATPKQAIPYVATDLHKLPDGNSYVWLGHSSYLLNLDGKRFLVDPVLVSATPMPFGGKPFAGADHYQPQDLPAIDYLIITHDHYDHLDYQTLRQIKDRIGQVICPLGVGAHLERWGFSPSQLIELDWQQSATLAEHFRLTALPARHSSGRAIKQNQTLWASYMLETPTETIYLGGDSGYAPFFKDIARQFPHISLAIMENGQYDEDWANIHFLPKDLIQAIQDLQPHTVIPVHNSKFQLAKHAWNEPLQQLDQSAQQAHIRVAFPKIGEVWNISEKPLTTEKWWQTPTDKE